MAIETAAATMKLLHSFRYTNFSQSDLWYANRTHANHFVSSRTWPAKQIQNGKGHSAQDTGHWTPD